MVEILPSPDHVVAIKISGTLTATDYDRIVAEVSAKLARHKRLGILVDMVDLDDFTLEAGWKDLRYKIPRQPRPGGPTIRISGVMGYGRLKIRHALR